MKFTSRKHEANFLTLMVQDNTYHDDRDRQALWYIIAGDDDLFCKRNHIYDFSDHSIHHCLEGGSVDFCSSSRALVRLGFNLYNNYPMEGMTPSELFWNLDSRNIKIALNAIRLRFDHTQILEFSCYENQTGTDRGQEETEEEEWTI